MIKDFGVKIGMAKKDLWKLRGLLYEDLSGMDEEEQSRYVKRDNIWPKCDLNKELAESGCDRFVIYWRNEIRKQIYPTPRNGVSHEEYINGVREIMKMSTEVKTEKDINCFYTKAKNGKLLKKNGYLMNYVPPFGGILNGKAFLKLSKEYNLIKLQIKMNSEGFGMSFDEAADYRYTTVLIDGKEYYPFFDRNKYCIIKEEGRGKWYYYPVDRSTDLSGSIDKYMLLRGNCILMISGSKEECIDKGKELYGKDLEKESNKRSSQKKKKWTPPQLDLKRMGPDSRHGNSISGEDLLDVFGIRGGEFGNWTSENERQKSLDLCYDSFHDLADSLGISHKDISLPGLKNGSLAIAFGARGSGNAVAHYEPLLEVINITKMRGAGSLAHEWGHAMDDLIAKRSGLYEFASEHPDDPRLPDSFREVMNAIIYKSKDGLTTDYYKQSTRYGNYFQKTGHGYWSEKCELLARAFSCYVMDKLEKKQQVNDYLCGHSEVNFLVTEKGEKIYAYPRGDERQKINACFDALIKEMKQLGWFHDSDSAENDGLQIPTIHMTSNGQLSFL